MRVAVLALFLLACGPGVNLGAPKGSGTGYSTVDPSCAKANADMVQLGFAVHYEPCIKQGCCPTETK